jgi:hypothetical protein
MDRFRLETCNGSDVNVSIYIRTITCLKSEPVHLHQNHYMSQVWTCPFTSEPLHVPSLNLSIYRSISASWIDSRHRKISTGLHFQNGHHNTAKIQHCSIWKVAFNIFFKPIVSRTMLNFCGIVVAILKMETGRNFSMSGINSGRWNRTMLNLCGIVVAILKMATGRNFSMSESIRDSKNSTLFDLKGSF